MCWLALGAGPRDLTRDVFGDASRVLWRARSSGSDRGSMGIGPAQGSFFEVRRIRPPGRAGVRTTLIVTATLAASYLPARRAVSE